MARTRQARRCSAHRRDGQPCRAYAIEGGRVCRMHGGAAPQVRAKAAERRTRARAYAAVVRLSRSPAYRERREIRELAFPGQSSWLDAAARAWDGGSRAG